MTIRQQYVTQEKTVLAEIPICDGCGEEVDPSDSDTTTWEPNTSDEEPVHTCGTCGIRNLSQTEISQLTRRDRFAHQIRSTLPSRDGIGSFRPQYPAFAGFAAMMGACTLAILFADFSFEGTAVLLAASGIAGLILLGFSTIDAISYQGQSGGGEAWIAVPFGGILGVVTTSSALVAWAMIISAMWFGVAYTTSRYILDELSS